MDSKHGEPMINDVLDFIQNNPTAITGLMAALIAFFYQRRQGYMENQKFRRELFFRYNEAYNELNDDLESLEKIEYESQITQDFDGEKSLYDIWNKFDHTPENKARVKKIFDYINLCSEEYYWYKKDFVDKDVWKCWHKGMNSWYKNLVILQVVIKREKTKKASYYNDDFLSLFDNQN